MSEMKSVLTHTNVSWQTEHDAVLVVSSRVCEEYCDLSGIYDVDGVVEHGDNETHLFMSVEMKTLLSSEVTYNERSSEFTALVPGKDVGWCQRLLERRESFPKSECDQSHKAAGECADDLGII